MPHLDSCWNPPQLPAIKMSMPLNPTDVCEAANKDALEAGEKASDLPTCGGGGGGGGGGAGGGGGKGSGKGGKGSGKGGDS